MAQHEQLDVLDVDAAAAAKQQLHQRPEDQVDELQDHSRDPLGGPLQRRRARADQRFGTLQVAEALALVLALLALAGTLAAAAVHSRWPVEAVAAVATAAGLVAVEALSVSDARQAPARERCHYQVAPCRGVGCEDRRHALLRFLARPPGSAWPARPSRREPGAKDIELMILRRELDVLRRQISRPAFRPADRAFLAAAACHLPRSAKPLLLVTRGLWFADTGCLSAASGARTAAGPADRGLGGDPGTRAPARTREPMLGSSPDLRCAGKLGLRASPTSVRRTARARPAASRAAAGGPSWREFLQAQAASNRRARAGEHEAGTVAVAGRRSARPMTPPPWIRLVQPIHAPPGVQQLPVPHGRALGLEAGCQGRVVA